MILEIATVFRPELSLFFSDWILEVILDIRKKGGDAEKVLNSHH